MLRNLFRRKKDSEDENLQDGPEQDQESVQPVLESEEMPIDKPIAQLSDEAPEEKRGWFSRLKVGLARTRDNLAGRISSLIGAGRKIDEELMEEIENEGVRNVTITESTLLASDQYGKQVGIDKKRSVRE